MDNYIDERDYLLLEDDKYTFYVLKSVMRGNCQLLLSDHEEIILCYTAHPYPVWIWTKDDAKEDIKEKAYQLAKENGFIEKGYRINMKHSLASYFIEKAKEDNHEVSIITNMYAYECPELIPPTTSTNGHLHKCVESDIEDLTSFIYLFHEELNLDKKDMESYRKDAISRIQKGNVYLWKNEDGESVASCAYTTNENLASIGLVYTKEKDRRKHIAENLVYQVSKIAKEDGYIPMLYTDADYIASNACYQKIGYLLQGGLCTIETVK